MANYIVGRDELGILLEQDDRLACLWDDLHRLAKAHSQQKGDGYVEKKRELAKKGKAVELCLGQLRWKQRKWLGGGVSALKAIRTEEQLLQMQQGLLFRYLLAEKTRLKREVMALDSNKQLRERLDCEGMPGGYEAAPGGDETRQKHCRTRVVEPQICRMAMRRISKPRHRWLKRAPSEDGLDDSSESPDCVPGLREAGLDVTPPSRT